MEFPTTIEIIVKPNQPKNSVELKEGKYHVCITEKPKNNKANIEIIKYFTKLTKKPVKIIKGITNKTKVLKFG